MYGDWTSTKKQQSQKKLHEKRIIEEKKIFDKQEKEKANQEALEKWFLKQAQTLEEDYHRKKLKKLKERDDKEKKNHLENMKKEQSQEAYLHWRRQKEEEKLKSKQEKTDRNQNKKRTLGNTGKITIGPYTKSKDLREIHKKLVNDQYFTDFQNDENKKNTKIEDSLQELSSIKKDNTPRSGVNEDDYN